MNCDKDIFITVDEALARMRQAISPIKVTEVVDLQLALGRILAGSITSPINVPAYDNSAMDGYALNILSGVNRYKIVSKIWAGQPDDTPLNAGECAQIMTGGKIPPGCNSVIMQENVTLVEEGVIETNTKLTKDDNIRLCGDDIAQGEEVYAPGHKLTAIDIGCLASLGFTQVTVVKQLTVGLFTTGDELVQPGQALGLGQIYDSNRPMLKALITQAGFNVVDIGVIEDNLLSIKQALSSLAKQCDVIITSGGVSVGVADFTGQAFAQLGEIDFWKVAMKPGKPFAFGSIFDEQRQVLFFGLPGNPVSSAVTFAVLAQPMLEYLSSGQSTKPLTLTLPLTKPVKKRAGRRDYQRAIMVFDEDGTPIGVEPFSKQSSGVLSDLAKADCYIVMEKEQLGLNTGQMVCVLPVAK